jgi:hypothetical protein
VEEVQGGARFDGCCHDDREVPVDFPGATASFWKTAGSGDVNGVNSFGCCLERDESVDLNLDLAANYYCSAVCQFHRCEVGNIGRCLEDATGLNVIWCMRWNIIELMPNRKSSSMQNDLRTVVGSGILSQATQPLSAHYSNCWPGNVIKMEQTIPTSVSNSVSVSARTSNSR